LKNAGMSLGIFSAAALFMKRCPSDSHANDAIGIKAASMSAINRRAKAEIDIRAVILTIMARHSKDYFCRDVMTGAAVFFA
jgi:hypothetical protein